MFIFPDINPILIDLWGLQIYWYGLMYVGGFLAFLFLGRRAVVKDGIPIAPEQVGYIMQAALLGVIIGGRIGYSLIYQLPHTLENPSYLFSIKQGGMSFHGGLIGVITSLVIYSYVTRTPLYIITDLAARFTPIGLGLGRIGNFINGELWGRVTSQELYWSMIFRHVDNLPRHPSMLYEAAGEGLLLYLLMWWHSTKCKHNPGIVSGLFLIYYSIIRFIVEFYREPDAHIGYISGLLTMGQILSIVMLGFGIALLIRVTLDVKPRDN